MRVLVVEDDDAIATMLTMWAQVHGDEIRVRQPEALTDGDMVWCDVALVDYMLPGVDGCTILGVLARLNPDARRVLWTAAREAVCGDAHTILHKPVDIDTLAGVLRGP